LTPRRSDGRLSVGRRETARKTQGITPGQWRHVHADLATVVAVGAGTPSIPVIAQTGETPCPHARQ